MTELAMPRITAQFEISGDENDHDLADLKRTERALEIFLAYCAGEWFKKLLEEDGIKSTLTVKDGLGKEIK